MLQIVSKQLNIFMLWSTVYIYHLLTMHPNKLPKYKTFNYLFNIHLPVTLTFGSRYGVEGHGNKCLMM